MGGVPVWITVALGVLAVVGTIGGAWGGQFIAGRNDSRKWQRERDREAQAFWRDKRLEVYATVLAEAQDVAAALWGAAGFGVRSRWTDNPPVSLAHLARELRQIEIIGSDATVEVVRAVDSLSNEVVSSLRHPARASVVAAIANPAEAEKGWPEPLYDMEPRLIELDKQVTELRRQFRRDLAVSPGGEAPAAERRRRLRLPGLQRNKQEPDEPPTLGEQIKAIRSKW
jgi:hypothetical protein